ncbi:MAG: hypothetical protein CMP39_05055 [Rickettsiales bacterium]|nr:hypothetical protein [Rickettsiales bacterium]|tara:strand:- start:1308 stop:2021 length:714 start_codon:yes stop_codon:yes gene_type:complete
MDINNPLNSMPNMPQPFTGGLGGADISPFDSYGVSNDFSIQLAKMQELIALQQQKHEKTTINEDIGSQLSDKIELDNIEKDEDKKNEENNFNLINTPEGVGFNTSINPHIDLNYIGKVIDKYFEEFMETSFENFKRKTKSLLETVNRTIETPFDKTMENKKDSPYNVIMHSIKTELSYLHENVQFTDEEIVSMDRTQFKSRFDYVVMTFQPLFPELANTNFNIESNSENDNLLENER